MMTSEVSTDLYFIQDNADEDTPLGHRIGLKVTKDTKSFLKSGSLKKNL